MNDVINLIYEQAEFETFRALQELAKSLEIFGVTGKLGGATQLGSEKFCGGIFIKNKRQVLVGTSFFCRDNCINITARIAGLDTGYFLSNYVSVPCNIKEINKVIKEMAAWIRANKRAVCFAMALLE